MMNLKPKIKYSNDFELFLILFKDCCYIDKYIIKKINISLVISVFFINIVNAFMYYI